MAKDLTDKSFELLLPPWSLWLSSTNSSLKWPGAMALAGLQWKDVCQQCGCESQKEGQGQGRRWVSKNDVRESITHKVEKATCSKPEVSPVFYLGGREKF